MSSVDSNLIVAGAASQKFSQAEIVFLYQQLALIGQMYPAKVMRKTQCSE